MKNLIKINLNQTVSKAQMDFIKEEKNRWIIFSSLCLLLVSIFIWFWFINFRLNYIISNRQVTINNIKIHGSGNNRIGVVSFNIENIHPHDLAQFLNEYNIALRVGHHCAQPLLSKLNETSTARLSTYLYNDEQDIDKLCLALQEIIGYFK